MSYLDNELRALLPFAVLGIIVGYASFLINYTSAAAVLMIVVAIAGKFAIAKVIKVKEDWKWWLGNAIIAYIFLWLVVWTILFNAFVL
ncbi:MAG: hypothetical protein HY513_01380 [Candidatus Aenigmarchaeota archaeon]|nr:hypothetical protein [Candidatus Aenigmarchaeota archaeon]